jgi:transcriptional regulator with XRE-family HTH domain
LRLDGNKVRRARERLGYSMEMVGEEAEVSKNSILRAEHDGDIRPVTARRIAQALGVEVADLIEESAIPKAAALPPTEPSFNNVLEEERRSPENLTARFKYQKRLLKEWLDRWEREIEDVEANRFILREGFGNDMTMKSLFALSHVFDKNEGKNMEDLESVLDDIRVGNVVAPDLRDAAEDLQKIAVRLSKLGPRSIEVERRQLAQTASPEESTLTNVVYREDSRWWQNRLDRQAG